MSDALPTDLVSDQLLKLADDAPMSASTRTRLRTLALRVQALERERTTCAHIAGNALGQLYSAAEREQHEESRAVATEQYWKDKQGDEYGSY